MKRLMSIVLFVVLMSSIAGCSFTDINKNSLQYNYEVDYENDYIIKDSTKLGLKLYNDEGEKIYLLGYLNDTLEINSENNYIKSFIIGKNCISITSTILDIKSIVSDSICVQILEDFDKSLNENTEKICEKKEDGLFYIVSKDEKYVFIDYITTIPNVYNKVIYCRIIVQDSSSLNITEKEYEVLPDYLPELKEVLKIEIDKTKEIRDSL